MQFWYLLYHCKTISSQSPSVTLQALAFSPFLLLAWTALSETKLRVIIRVIVNYHGVYRFLASRQWCWRLFTSRYWIETCSIREKFVLTPIMKRNTATNMTSERWAMNVTSLRKFSINFKALPLMLRYLASIKKSL